MTATYTWRLARVDSGIGLDAMALLFNESEGVVEITEISAICPAPCTNGAVNGTWHFRRISAIDTSSGVAMGVSKFDTSAADLPPQVLAWAEPAGVTETPDAVLRGLADCPAFTWISAGSLSSTRWSTGRFGNQAGVFHGGRTPLEPIVLREGEGIACIQVAIGTPHASTVNFRVRELGTQKVYVLRTRDFGSRRSELPLYAIFNGVGSGVVLEILSWEMVEDGDSYPGSLRVCLVEGYSDPGGNAVLEQPSQMDPGGPLLSPDVKLVRGPVLASLMGTSLGVPFDWARGNPAISLGVQNVITTAPQANNGMPVRDQQTIGTFRAMTKVFPITVPTTGTIPFLYDAQILWKARSGKGIVCRKGVGVAVAVGRSGYIDSSAFNFYDIRITFTYKSNANFLPIGDMRTMRAL